MIDTYTALFVLGGILIYTAGTINGIRLGERRGKRQVYEVATAQVAALVRQLESPK